MPCKHEGGSDPCERYKSGNCKACLRRYRQEHIESVHEYERNRTGGGGKGTNSDRGQAGEFLVAADLLSRGLPTTKPLNINGAHDLHAKCAGAWFTIQVRLARINTKTGALQARERSGIVSDILAIADLAGKRIRYLPHAIPELPQELM
jgi:hypothetical protein